jgi:hypothetical protein
MFGDGADGRIDAILAVVAGAQSSRKDPVPLPPVCQLIG